MSLTVYRTLEDFRRADIGPTAVTLGTFDGIHLGHKAILDTLGRKAKKHNVPAVALTFHPHPRTIVTPENPPLLLTTPEEKVVILENTFPGHLVFLKFDEQLRKMSAEEFVESILIEVFRIKSLVVGYDHGFGHKRGGDTETLKKIASRNGFELEVVGPVTFGDQAISSSRIRKAIQNGNLQEAEKMLGHRFPMHGTVVKGIGEGHKLGWPTLNIEWSVRKILPREGVYSCLAEVNGSTYQGMMFVGVNMLNPDAKVSVEANLFSFDRDIYGKEVTLYPIGFVRPNARFESRDALARQIADDKKKVKQMLNDK